MKIFKYQCNICSHVSNDKSYYHAIVDGESPGVNHGKYFILTHDESGFGASNIHICWPCMNKIENALRQH